MENILRNKFSCTCLDFGEMLLQEQNGQSQVSSVAQSCLLGQPITAQDLDHLARLQGLPYNNNYYIVPTA